MRVKDVEENLERTEARFKRQSGLDTTLEQRERKKKMTRILVGIFAVACAIYAIASSL